MKAVSILRSDLKRFLVFDCGRSVGWKFCWTICCWRREFTLATLGCARGCKVVQSGWRYVFCRRHLALYSAMNLHIYPSASGLLWGRRGKDGDSAACRKNAGWPGFSSSGSSDDLSGWSHGGEGLFVLNNEIGWRMCWECINIKWCSNFQLGNVLVSW